MNFVKRAESREVLEIPYQSVPVLITKSVNLSADRRGLKVRYWGFAIFKVTFCTKSKPFPLSCTRVVMNFENLVINAIGGQK